MKIHWTEDLATGVEILDAQHRELFARIDALLEACMQRRGAEQMLDTMRFLEGYVVEHFGMEEELMRRYEYAGLRDHEAQHREFRQRVTDLSAEILQEDMGPLMVLKVNRLLVEWLNSHIRQTDRTMAIEMREHFAAEMKNRQIGT